MRSYVSFAALVALCASSAKAQEIPDAGGRVLADGGGQAVPANIDQLKADILKEVQAQEDLKLQKMRDELRDEIRAEMTTAQAPPQEFEELPEEKPKLQFLELNGYFRFRPTLLQNMTLGWSQPDPQGYYLFPRPFSDPADKTDETADLRFRVEPTLNVSEDIRIRGQIDVLDNLVLGSTPELSTATPYTAVSQSQVSPSTLLGNLQNDSFRAKRLWAEVTIPPIGQLRFGRMGNHWGLGMYQNDGNCLDCDSGNTVDRIMLVLKIANHYIIPMMDWAGAGALYNTYAGDQLGQPVSFDRLLEAYQYGIQIARRDSDEELKALAEQGKLSFNYGFYGTIRNQDHDLVALNGTGGYGQVTPSGGQCLTQQTPNTALLGTGPNPNSTLFNNNPNGICGVDGRGAAFYVPDVWARFKTRRLRLETELVYVNGSYTINAEQATADPNDNIQQNNVNHKINESSFGGAFQGEYKFLSDLQLSVGFDMGLATGNHAYGFGAQPGRTNPFGPVSTSAGSIDGNPIYCPNNTEPCLRSTINAFSFSPDYRIDQILWRQILGSVTDAFFLKPTVKYRFFEGLDASISAIYSQAMLGNLTPGGQAPLGLETDVGVHYHTEDGFIANLDYGILVPFGGLSENTGVGNVLGTSVAQAIRLYLGVKY